MPAMISALGRCKMSLFDRLCGLRIEVSGSRTSLYSRILDNLVVGRGLGVLGGSVKATAMRLRPPSTIAAGDLVDDDDDDDNRGGGVER